MALVMESFWAEAAAMTQHVQPPLYRSWSHIKSLHATSNRESIKHVDFLLSSICDLIIHIVSIRNLTDKQYGQ